MRLFVRRVVEAAIASGRLPRPAVKVTFALAASAARLFSRISGSAELLEFSNILEAIKYFAGPQPSASAIQGKLPANSGDESRLAPPFGAPTFEALWAAEGLGYWNTKSALKAEPDRMIDLSISSRLPPRRRGIFHVGITVALAEHTIGRAAKESPVHVEDALQSYLRTCRQQSPATLWGIEAESLGFILAALFPELLHRAADVLSRDHRSLRKYFWHGVGRGLYFKYPRALDRPGQSWSALNWALQLPSDAEDAADTLEGFCWALVLVNLRHPSVIRDRVGEVCSSKCETEPLVSGVCEALLCWQRWAGWDDNLERISAFVSAQHNETEAGTGVVNTALSRLSERSVGGRPVDRGYGDLLGPQLPRGDMGLQVRHRSPMG